MKRRRQMNPRQRQGLLLVLIALLGMVGVFVLIANYVSSVSKQVGPMVNVLVLRQTLRPFEAVTDADLGYTPVPARWAGSALRNPSAVFGLINENPTSLPVGTRLQPGMLTSPPSVPVGDHTIALSVDQEAGVGSQVQTNSTVDMIAAFPNSTGQPASTQVVVSGVKVLLAQASASTNGGEVMLAVTPRQELRVRYAEVFAQKYWLSLVTPGAPNPSQQSAPYRLGQ